MKSIEGKGSLRIYDELTFFIIGAIYEAGLKKEEITTGEIARKYNWQDKREFKTDSERRRFFTDKTSSVAGRLKNLEKRGLLTIEHQCKECENYYVIEKFLKKEEMFECPNCKCQNKSKGMLKRFTLLGEKVLVVRHRWLKEVRKSILIKEGKWCGFEID